MSITLPLHPGEFVAPAEELATRAGAPGLLPTQPAKILLLSMPFGLPYMPSLGLSLLKAGLATRGIAADVRYLGLPFAQTVGYPFYQRLAHGGGGFLGDWIFYPVLYGTPSSAQTAGFWRLAFPHRSPRGLAPSFAALQERVGRAQAQAQAFVEHCLAEIPWAQYEMVGFTTMFQQNLASLAMARRLKEAHPHLTILLGGPNAEGKMGAALMTCFPFIDYVFSSESDRSFPAFVAAWLAGDTDTLWPGVVSRQAPGGAVRRSGLVGRAYQ